MTFRGRAKGKVVDKNRGHAPGLRLGVQRNLLEVGDQGGLAVDNLVASEPELTVEEHDQDPARRRRQGSIDEDLVAGVDAHAAGQRVGGHPQHECGCRTPDQVSFPSDYDWHSARDEKGRPASRRNLVKMAGNAVTPPAARDLIACVVEALGGEFDLGAAA